MYLRATFFLVATYAAISVTKADCLACWELRKVEVTLKNGKTHTGFVYWNDLWLHDAPQQLKKSANTFPENFIAYNRYRSKQKFYLLTKLTVVKNDSLIQILAITKDDQEAIVIDDIQRIIEIDKQAEKYRGAGDIPIYTPEELIKLNTNPHATYKSDIGSANVYYLSYNKKVGREELIKISKQGEINAEELSRMGVITITIGYD